MSVSLPQGFSHNITAYHFARLASAMEPLTQDFSTAYSTITASEAAYSATVSNLQAAVRGVSARFSRVTDALGRYLAASADVAESELKGVADELFRTLNESYSIGNEIVTMALPVSAHDIT